MRMRKKSARSVLLHWSHFIWREEKHEWFKQKFYLFIFVFFLPRRTAATQQINRSIIMVHPQISRKLNTICNTQDSYWKFRFPCWECSRVSSPFFFSFVVVIAFHYLYFALLDTSMNKIHSNFRIFEFRIEILEHYQLWIFNYCIRRTFTAVTAHSFTMQHSVKWLVLGMLSWAQQEEMIQFDTKR